MRQRRNGGSLRVAIHAVGRMKAGPEKELLERYLDRSAASGRSLGLKLDPVREYPESRAATPDLRSTQEADALLGAIGQDAFVIMLDEGGSDPGSREFANLIRSRQESACDLVAFVIGGPDGHGEAMRERADLAIRFGRLTWPHQLVRVLLAEQIYRAITILSGHPYHRQ